MRILVQKVRDGVSEITIIPNRRARKAPIVVRGTDRAAVMAEAATVIVDIARLEEPDVEQLVLF